ncbi:nuclear transcription factor Y subunit B-1-like [Rhodamnia argentea]|uniref:Nuclear transcription factor Y subunit B-1-like n=1 Tax=Rhodamnia argentea TaxID=178133 RepID=A0A8B8Q9Q6_9MYRT|nr:nuclear transcription factor Y subunit B-1-like [Rhodamnia argentea]
MCLFAYIEGGQVLKQFQESDVSLFDRVLDLLSQMVDKFGSNSDREGDNKYDFSGGAATSASNEEASPIREQDRLLPIANVGRIMKQILPPNAKISKEAKETMQECVSEFISFVTGEASDKCHREKRKTVNGDDIVWALGSLGFDDYAEPLKRYLNQYREVEGERASQSKATASDSRNERNSYGDESLEKQPGAAASSLPLEFFDVAGRSTNGSFSKRF